MLQKSSILSVLDVFFKEPTKKHYLIEISRNIKIAHTSVKKHLDELVKNNLIKVSFEKKGKRIFPLYEANLSNNQYKLYKKLKNINSLIEIGLIDFLNDDLMPSSIVLFGSYSRGEDIEDSDIDLFVCCQKKELNLIKFEKKLNRKIQLHFKFNFKDFSNDLKNNIINGIVLSGFLEGFK